MKSRKRIKKKSGPTPPTRQNIPPDTPNSTLRDAAMITGIYLTCIIIIAAIAIGTTLYRKYSKASNKMEHHKKR